MFAENRCLQIDSACSNGYQCDQRVLLFGNISSHTNLVKLFLSVSVIFACLISAGFFSFSSRLIVDIKVVDIKDGNYFSKPPESFDVLSISTRKSFVLITIIYNCSTIDRVFKVLFHSFNARNVLGARKKCSVESSDPSWCSWSFPCLHQLCPGQCHYIAETTEGRPFFSLSRVTGG